ncbi:hypothetical protein [Salinimicrobium gaetbulicola]|uniref:Lipoprotein n=1 Tax=Salinimicrobium gaetbulicola TaxID=999702 RepID=A0ABW3IFG0_9FLAO
MKSIRFICLVLRLHKFTGSRLLSFILLLVFLGFSGCSYYKVKKTPLNTPPEIQIKKLEPEERYVIIHSGNQMMHLNEVTVDDDKKELKGKLTAINERHNLPQPQNNKTYRYKRGSKDPLNEVHFYTSQDLNFTLGDEVSIPFSEMDSVSVNNPNTGKSVINVVGTTVAVMAVAVAIVALTKSSCPFIYVKDGREYVFQGELYPGAITPNIQRDDYLPMPRLNTADEEYIIKVTNELYEIQHTDLLQLIVLEHPEDVQVLLDKKGKPHSFSQIQAPEKATYDDLNEALPVLLEQDSKSFLFDSGSGTADGSRSLILEFAKPAGAKQAKLFLTAKNSFWLDYTFGKFNEQFGYYYNTFQKDQLEMPGEESKQWAVDQNIPLSVYLKTNDGWDLVEQVITVGPLAFRDMVVPIDLTGDMQENVVLKLETGFMFWEIDRAGIDFSENVPLKEVVLEPSFAVDENGQDVTDLLTKTDGKYLTQPEIGNEVTVIFKHERGNDNLSSTAFLKNRGYYTYIRDYKGIPNFAKLEKFREKGRFSLFSEEQYQKFIDEEMLDLALTYGN